MLRIIYIVLYNNLLQLFIHSHISTTFMLLLCETLLGTYWVADEISVIYYYLLNVIIIIIIIIIVIRSCL
jgi:hypothetical protein